jgi:hypothetical protein
MTQFEIYPAECTGQILQAAFLPNDPNTFLTTCYSDYYLRAYTLSSSHITLVNTWSSGTSGTLNGIAFFPNDALNRALIAFTGCCIKTIQVTSATSITATNSYSLANDFRQIAISPTGTNAIFTVNSSNLINYYSVSPTSLSLLQSVALSSGSYPVCVTYINN